MNLNIKAYKILKKLGGERNVKIEEFDRGRVTLVDVGVNAEGDLDTGIKVAEATMAGLGKVGVDNKIRVRIDQMPAVATISSQLAGWCVKMGDKIALGSGPVRIPAKKPGDIIEKIGYSEDPDKGALVLETPIIPDRETCEKILKESNVDDLIIAVFRENSPVGLINVLSRVVEVGIFRLLNLGYDVNMISHAEGTAPLIKLSDDIMFEANDAIIYDGFVELKVKDWDPKITEKATSGYSKAYGKPFKEIFNKAGKNFYNIPADIFAPAGLKVTDLKTNRVYSSGKV